MSKQIRKKYSNEFKHEAIGLVVDQGYSKAEAGRSLGIAPDLIRRWQREFEADGSHAFPGQGKLPPDQQRIRDLENENRRLRMEKDILKKATENSTLLRARKVMRYQFIESHKKTWPINLMCQTLNISTSGYYDWYRRPESSQSQSNRVLDSQIQQIYTEHKQRYGVPRITHELEDQGFNYSENRDARRMQKLGLKGVQAKRFKRTTDSNHSKPVASDLINQDFTAAAPNQKWVSDLTYVWTDEGWLYLAVIMDLYSRAIIGWSMGKRMTQKLIKVMGFRCSMGRRATCYDNAAMESFFHTLKVEMIHREWYLTRPSAKRAIFEYIEVYYNRKRKYFAIGYQTPIQFEQKRA